MKREDPCCNSPALPLLLYESCLPLFLSRLNFPSNTLKSISLPLFCWVKLFGLFIKFHQRECAAVLVMAEQRPLQITKYPSPFQSNQRAVAEYVWYWNIMSKTADIVINGQIWANGLPRTGRAVLSPAVATRCSGCVRRAQGGCYCFHTCTGVSASECRTPDLHGYK